MAQVIYMHKLHWLSSNLEERTVRLAIMRDYGRSISVVEGRNKKGELLLLNISQTSLGVETWCKDGTIKFEYYDEWGVKTDEVIRGRWDRDE
jgi:hypothetical protein